MSLGLQTAIREAEPLGRPISPLVICTYRVDVEPICDTRDKHERREMCIAEEDLVCPTWEAEMQSGTVPRSQALADRLGAAGQFGMVVRSFARGAGPTDMNLVLWKWTDNTVKLIDPEGRLSCPGSGGG